MFHITFVQIGGFDWLSGRQKGSIFVKMFKNLLLRNHKENEAETWHTCLGHYPLQKLCFLFRSDKNSGCYGNLDLQWEKWKLTIFAKSFGIFDFFFTEMFIE